MVGRPTRRDGRGLLGHLGMAAWSFVIDEFAKTHLHDHLRWVREALVWKLDGLSEYDIRRPCP
jgi:hypothetical protein